MITPHRIAGQFYNRPLLLLPAAADTISNFLIARGSTAADMRRGAGGDDDARQERVLFEPTRGADGTTTVHSPTASRFHGDVPLSEDGSRRPLPFRRTEAGVSIITLVGEWVNRGGYVGASSGVISYEGFKYQLEVAGSDPRTKAVLLDMESPGGEAVGAFEAAAAVRRLAQVKPVWALVNGLAASAAYAIASAATRIVSIPTGISGSIGVVLAHFDYSEMLAKEGIRPTFIHAGARKVDANPYQALPEKVRDKLQAEVNTFYDLFVETVAAGRSGLSTKAIRDTEAGTFMGAEALELGLIDALGGIEDVLAELGAGRGGAPQARPGQAGPAAKSAHTPFPAASAALSSEETTVTETEAEGIRAAERQRFRSILTSPEAQGREAQASELAFSTSLSFETCVSILKAAPRVNDDTAAFIAAKEAQPNLSLEPDATGAGGKADAGFSWDEIVAKHNADAGVKAPVR
ncbi:S49 family peptidase [Methylobacterium fujisawaense]|uniref:S49 family peptidase n=1 Tax=Methylobacterium fujisawaense TaxID=107400 RepID=UPI00244787CE|nr:S49 family peptidase [Methylobacterium fujisawaense]MDH3031067.1 S49 family peptidase [Methylobacterium fujisawaense]